MRRRSGGYRALRPYAETLQVAQHASWLRRGDPSRLARFAAADAGTFHITPLGSWRSQVMLREDRWGRTEAVPMDARVARSGFYTGYVGRIGDRLASARAAAEREAEVEYAAEPAEPSYAGRELISTAVVIAAKQERVHDFYAESSRARGRWSGPSSRAGAERAMAAGWAAGGRARLGDDRDALIA